MTRTSAQAPPPDVLDATIIGGGAAGLTAATVLGRACRDVRLVDDGEQSNSAASQYHGVFGHDDGSPSVLYEAARGRLASYPNVHLLGDTVVEVSREGEHLRVRTAGERTWLTRTVLLAQGAAYELPGIPGLRELWGTKVWHCPFCDGYEHRGKKILVLSDQEGIDHSSVILPSWSRDLSWAETEVPLSHPTRQRIQDAGGRVVPAVVTVEDAGQGVTAHHADGSSEDFDSVHVGTTICQRDDLATLLGCRTLDSGRVERLDESGRTSVDGVFVAGDQTDIAQQINIAVASGHLAAVGMVTHLAGQDREREKGSGRRSSTAHA